MTHTTAFTEAGLSSTFVFVRIELPPLVSLREYHLITNDVIDFLAFGIYLEANEMEFTARGSSLSGMRVVRAHYGSPFELDLQMMQSVAVSASAGIASAAYLLNQVSKAVKNLAEARKLRAEAASQEVRNAIAANKAGGIALHSRREFIEELKAASVDLPQKHQRNLMRLIGKVENSRASQSLRPDQTRRGKAERDLIQSVTRMAHREVDVRVEK